MFGEIKFLSIYIFLFFGLSEATANVHTKPSEASSPGQRQVTLRIYPAVIPPYAQYPKQNLIYYAGYPYGNTYPLQGNLLPVYFHRGNIYQGTSIPNQHENFFGNLPTRIIDVDEKGNIKTPSKDPIFSMRQGNSKTTESRNYPIKLVKSNFATTKPITITINRNSGQSDSVINYNFENGELVNPRIKKAENSTQPNERNITNTFSKNTESRIKRRKFNRHQ